MTDEPFGLERHIALRPHHTRWAGLFEAEHSRLSAVLGDDADVQHVGSTAIPGLGAKPISDIAIGTRDFGAAFAFAVTAYQALKLELARQFPRNREAYIDGKYAFVQDILSRAE